MANKIQWIKNLLGYGSTAEQAAVREAAEHARKTGLEMSVVGRTGDDPANLSRSYGDSQRVVMPPDWHQIRLDAAKSGDPVFTAHPHPVMSPVPSAGDISTWANDVYVPEFKKQGTFLGPDKFARENMWITGVKGPNDTLMMPSLKYTNTTDDYELLRKLREVDAKYDMNIVDPTKRKAHVDAYWKFSPKGKLSDNEVNDYWNSLLMAEKADQYAQHTPLLMDPANMMIRNYPDLHTGDVTREWLKHLDKEGASLYKAEGGQYDEPMPPFPLAYGSQYFAAGGQVPHFQTGGPKAPQIIRDNLEPALQNIFKYFGKLDKVVPHKEIRGPAPIQHWYTPYIEQGTTYPWRAGDDWRLVRENQKQQVLDHYSAKGMDPINIDRSDFPLATGRPYLPQVPEIDDLVARGAARGYTGDEYGDMNEALRQFAINQDKAKRAAGPYNNEWWRGDTQRDVDSASRGAYLAKWLQDQEYELPFDIFRSSRMRVNPDKLDIGEAPQAHGRGIGSFSFNPNTAYGFGRDEFVPPKEWGTTPGHAKMPFITRIPQGTKVRGANVSEYSSNPSEVEVLMAPFQGYDVLNSGLVLPDPHYVPQHSTPRILMNAVPSGVYNPDTPQLHAYGGQHFDKGGPVLPAITGLQAMQQYVTALKDIFRKPVTVAAPDNAWARIVNDGRFKSQHETGTSRGTFDPQARVWTEKGLFGIPEDIDPVKRPIYGHVADLSNLGTHAYGKWGAVLDPSVKKRSTFMLDDSLMQSPGSHGPYEFSEGFRKQQDNLNKWIENYIGLKPTDEEVRYSTAYGSRPFHADEPITAGKLPHAASIPYIETQTHGGLPWADVRAMVRKRTMAQPDPDMAADHAQWMADTTGRRSFVPWSDTDMGGVQPQWLQAEPGDRASNVIRVPKSALTKFMGYAEGGQYEDTPFPNVYDKGGEVHPTLAMTGPEIMRKGVDKALQGIIEYFGGAKRPTIKHTGTEPGEVRVHPEIPYWATRFADTTWKPSASAAGSTDAQWLEAMREAGIDVSKALELNNPVRNAIEQYTGSSYDSMSGILRKFAENPNKAAPQGNNYVPNLGMWRRDDSGYRIAELAKYLQDNEFELPFDIFRGNRMRGVDDLPHPEHGLPQVRGTGIGSFSYTPSTAYSFGQDQVKLKTQLHHGAFDWERAENQTKIPSVIRIPQGTKVRGMNVAQYSGLPTESEVLLAPFQGFDVTDFNLISPAQHTYGSNPRFQLNVEPSGIYDPHSPIIFQEGGQVPGYQHGGLTNIINYIRGTSKPIKGYHVSPHDFDKFSSNYIGTGEGNKNFGHGLYFMESPSLRDRYVKDLGDQFSGQRMREYDVDIHGDPRHFLSLDEPLDVQGVLGMRAADYLNTPKSTILRPPELTFPRMESQVTDPAFAKFMGDEGAYGTRYFDSRSKKVGHGTQNYVTFPTMDDIIEITSKRAEGGQFDDMPLAYMSQNYAEGGEVEGFQTGGFNEAPDRFSVPPSQFTAPRGVTTPTFDFPIGKGQGTAGFSYDPQDRLIDAILGYEHPLGRRGATLGVTGNFNKYIGPGGNEVPPNWGARIGLTLPFAEGGQFDPYDDIAEAARLMGAYK